MRQRRIYQEEYPYFITARIMGDYPLFEKTEYAQLLSNIIFQAGVLKRWDILSYQIMPDHVHLLVQNYMVLNTNRAHPSVGAIGSNKNAIAGTESRSRRLCNITQFMHTVKSYYCNAIRKQYCINFPFWQKRFYALIVDNEYFLENVIEYIKQNPVKERLPRRYHEFPY